MSAPLSPRTAFKSIAKARQQRFRDTSPSVSATGRSPSDQPWRQHGHLLALGCEDENLYPGLRGARGARDFFSVRRVKWWRSPQSGVADGNGPTRHLTSSQLLCVNFLLPLAAHPAALAALLRRLDADVADVLELEYTPPEQTGSVRSRVDFEWVGLNRTLEGGPYTRGAHATSADALLVGVLPGGRRRAYLMEWKYTECYRPKHWLGKGDAGEVRRARYQARYARDAGCLDPWVPLNELLYEPIYQIARLGLLADLMVEFGTFGVTEARVVVVCPEENTPYRQTITSPELMERFPECSDLGSLASRLWRDPAGFRITSPAALLGAVQSEGPVAPAEWVAYQHERYGW